MNETTRPIVLSSGEPAGIGPDICCALAAEPVAGRLVVIGDPNVIAARAAAIGARVDMTLCERLGDVEPHRAGRLQLLAVAAAAPVTPGRLDPANAGYVLGMLTLAADLCARGEAGAMVTAPVQKSVINESGRPFSGHTEFLAELTGAEQPVMLLASPRLRVALATTHLPLRQVADALTPARLERILDVLAADLESKFGIAGPRILVLGLNPHAGERGALGDEELATIGPVVERLRAGGMNVIGPVPADTAFTPESLARCDVVLAMYHDQGLPVLKAAGFGEIVNVTLGLPIVRTSVDHGTALELAGTGRARHESLRSAVSMAAALAGNSGP